MDKRLNKIKTELVDALSDVVNNRFENSYANRDAADYMLMTFEENLFDKDYKEYIEGMFIEHSEFFTYYGITLRSNSKYTKYKNLLLAV